MKGRATPANRSRSAAKIVGKQPGSRTRALATLAAHRLTGIAVAIGRLNVSMR